MFEVTTEYNKNIFFKCFKVHYKFFSKYNKNRTILLLLLCLIIAITALFLVLIKPETFRVAFTSAFFYIMALVSLSGIITISDRGIKRKVDKIFKKNPNMNLTVKYIFNEDKFLSVHGENDTLNYEYANIIHFEVADEYIIVLLKNKKFFALNTTDEKVIEFLKRKTTK